MSLRAGHRWWGIWLCVGCATASQPSPELLRAERLERAGSIDEAAAAYDLASHNCSPRTKERCAEIAFRKGQVLEEGGRITAAVAAYREVESRFAGTSAAARALSRAALRTGDASLDELILLDYADETAADEALARIVARYRAEGRDRDLIEVLGQWHGRLLRREVDDNLLFEAAGAAERLGDAGLAMQICDELTRTYPHSPLRDDAMWAVAGLHEKHGDKREAVRAYQRLVDTRRESWFVGSYHSQYLDDAQLRIGLIQLDDLRDVAGARHAFTWLRDSMWWSVLRDDAQFGLARASAVAGDSARACHELDELYRRFPDTNRGIDARQLGTLVHCEQR